jgi:hypothetical protein
MGNPRLRLKGVNRSSPGNHDIGYSDSSMPAPLSTIMVTSLTSRESRTRLRTMPRRI